MGQGLRVLGTTWAYRDREHLVVFMVHCLRVRFAVVIIRLLSQEALKMLI